MIVPARSRKRKFLDVAVIRPILRRIHCFFTYTESERAGIRTVAGKDIPYQLLLNGADLPRSWSVEPPNDTAHMWQIAFAARLHPRKRVALFVAMAEALASELPVPIRFVVYGADEGDVEYVRSAAATGIVSYPGALPLEALRDALQQADILVLPSVNEPFSVTILDAQARGCPVVVSDTNGYASYVAKWSSGSVFISDDLESLTGSVRAMIADNRAYRYMRRQARAVVENEFSWDAIAASLSIYYREALERQL